jgi:Domain of unknown function (DUF4145)
MKRFWIQAHDSLANENWDAANVMARSALQFTVRDSAIEGKLVAQINDLATKGVLHPLMKDWAHEVRLLANESAHPEAPTPADVTPQDVRNIVDFLDLLSCISTICRSKSRTIDSAKPQHPHLLRREVCSIARSTAQNFAGRTR